VSPVVASAFDLPDHLAAKADPALVAADEQHFAAIGQCLEQSIVDLSERLDAERRAPGGLGQAAMDRDLEIHRLSSRLRTLRRFGLDLCLGHLVDAEHRQPVYIGRLGLTDSAGRRLLLDWRSPAAEPFFGATHANPMGLASRRRYRWTRGRISDYWDEVFTPDGLEGHAALDDQSAFIASLGDTRSPRMRDVLGTIQADQDAIIRAGSRGALVVDGGPGTGKTVVALHRAAYLLYSDPRVSHRRGGVLFVGPHRPYLAYVADVLPGLGEDGVRTCTLRDLVAEGRVTEGRVAEGRVAEGRVAEGRVAEGGGAEGGGAAGRAAEALGVETDPQAARLKASGALVDAVEAAVRFYEEPPTAALTVSTEWAQTRLTAADWAEAFDAPGPGTPHNEAREAILDHLVDILTDQHDLNDDEDGRGRGGASESMVRASLRRNRVLRRSLAEAWPLVEATDLVGDLWSVPAYLRRCAPWLTAAEARSLRRADPRAWTVSDLPLLDAARLRLGDPEAERRTRRQRAAAEAERTRMRRVVDELITVSRDGNSGDEYGSGLVRMLRHQNFDHELVDAAAVESVAPDELAGPFAHIVVDEAQELTDAEWRMLLARCPSRSFTIVGDRAQARHGFTESWRDRLTRVGFDEITLASLSINYRTPSEVMAEAEPAIRAALPDANVPTSIRTGGRPVQHGRLAERDAILAGWLAEHAEGTACVIGDPAFIPTVRVRSLTPELAKGLEFDLVVVADLAAFGTGIGGAVDRYVAMTRATQQLVVLTR
jgi:hypothetical protein